MTHSIVVPDGTGEVIDKLSKKYNVIPVHREGKLGLGSAVTTGFEHASGEILGVMDGDQSHPPWVVPELVEPILKGEADMVVGSRYVEGGGVEVWPWYRRMISIFATLPARPLTGVSDPMSGFFAFRRSVIKGKTLNVRGYKIGMEILVKGDVRKVVEVSYLFRNRELGESKLDMSEYLDYLKNLLKLYRYHFQNRKVFRVR